MHFTFPDSNISKVLVSCRCHHSNNIRRKKISNYNSSCSSNSSSSNRILITGVGRVWGECLSTTRLFRKNTRNEHQLLGSIY